MGSIKIVVEGQDVVKCSAVFSFAPHSQAAVGVVLILRIVDRNNSRPVQKRLSLTSACLGKNIPDGNELTSALSACSRNVFSPTLVLFVIRPLCCARA